MNSECEYSEYSEYSEHIDSTDQDLVPVQTVIHSNLGHSVRSTIGQCMGGSSERYDSPESQVSSGTVRTVLAIEGEQGCRVQSLKTIRLEYVCIE
jgi:hypothetical protein